MLKAQKLWQMLVVLLVLFVPSQLRGQTESVLYTFLGGSDGGVPYSSLVMDSDGNLYGTTEQYGVGNCNFPYIGCGTVFMLSHDDHGGWNFQTIYSFQGGADGATPDGPLLLDSRGNLFGTTNFGGRYDWGTVFELEKQGNTWQEEVIYAFSGGADGGAPTSALSFDRAGNIYGTTPYGGDNNCFYVGTGCGVVFELRHASIAIHAWSQSVLYTFSGSDGADPFDGVTLDAAGNIYGVAALGGQGTGGSSGGVAFKLQRSGNSWVESTLYEFPEFNGNPVGQLLFDKQGNLYGMTELGGSYGVGSVFELERPAQNNEPWIEADLYSFPGPPDGWFPLFSGVVSDKGGRLYGTTMRGGTNSNCQTGCGTVFQLTKSPGGIWLETGLFSFGGDLNGFYPFAGVILDAKGNVYGMTPNGGDPSCSAYSLPGCGVVFRIRR